MSNTVKRRKTAHACESCRQRKSKCDGDRPVCSVCLHTGNECHYLVPERDKQRVVSTEPSKAVESRLRAIEHTLQELIARLSADGVPHNPITTKSASENLPRINEGVTSSWSSVRGDSVDGMGSITFQDELGKAYFGPSSNSAFFAQISAVLTDPSFKNLMADRRSIAQDDSTTNLSRPVTPLQQPEQHEVPKMTSLDSLSPLPSLGEMLNLVDVFFSNSGLLFPFLDKKKVIQICIKMADFRFQSLERCQCCLANMVMALACVFNGSDLDVEHKLSDGEVFLRQALLLLPHFERRNATLESVQSLLLIAKYFQGTRRAAQTWNIHGVVVQAAYQIGMCSQPADPGMNAAEAESWKRTWWMCFMMDKMCSMTFGRPPLIPNSFMQQGLPLDTSYETLRGDELSQSPESNVKDPSEPSLFIQTSKLNLILGDVIEHLYHQNIEVSPKASLDKCLMDVMRTEAQLTEWNNQLPLSLNLVDSEQAHKPNESHRQHRFRTILTIRYNSIRSLAHRAVLTRILESMSKQTSHAKGLDFSNRFVVASLESSFESASTTIRIIGSTVIQENSLPVWWFSIYYTFNSALIIFALILISLRHDISSQWSSRERLLSSLKQALEALNGLKGGLFLRQRCRKVLQRLVNVASILVQEHATIGTSANEQPRSQEGFVVEPASNLPCATEHSLEYPDLGNFIPGDDPFVGIELDPFSLNFLGQDDDSWLL